MRGKNLTKFVNLAYSVITSWLDATIRDEATHKEVDFH